MTNPNDLIRRGDALELFEGPDDCPVQFEYGEGRYRINAIPAAPDTPEVFEDPRVMALVEALRYYADFHENPSDGPWGINSHDFGKTARAAIAAWEASHDR